MDLGLSAWLGQHHLDLDTLGARGSATASRQVVPSSYTGTVLVRRQTPGFDLYRHSWYNAERVPLMTWRHKLPDKRDLLVLALLVLLPILSFSALFFSKQTLYRQDIVSIYYPLSVFKAHLLRSGQIPLWNPHIQFGFPQLADQDVLGLHPLSLLFLLPLAPTLAFSLFVVAHFVMAGVFSYLLARYLQMSRVGALVTAVTFSLSGYLMAQLTNVNVMTGSVWLPLILFLFLKALQTKSLPYAIACGGTIALQILASHPQVVFYSLLTLGAYGAFWLIRLWRDTKVASQERTRTTIVLLSLMATAGVAGISLAALQIVPTWELKGLSPRGSGLNYAIMTSYSLPPYNLLTFLFPNILGNPVIGYSGEDTFEELHAYVGILPLLLVPWACARKKQDSRVAFFAILAGASLLLALGRYTPLYHLLVHMPGFNFFRVPARWLFIVTFSFSVLAGYGFDALAEGHGRAGFRRFSIFWRSLFWLNLGLTLVLLLCLTLRQQVIQRLDTLGTGLLSEPALERTRLLFEGLTRRPLVQFAKTPSATVSSLNPAVLFVLFSSCGFLLIYLWNRRRLSAVMFQSLVVGLIVVDLLLAGGTTINPVRRASYFERPFESRTFLQQNAGLHRAFSFVLKDEVKDLLDDIPSAYGLYSAGGHISELVLQRYNTFINMPDKGAALLNLAGVKYALVDKGAEYPGWVRAYAGSDLEIYENPSVLPRAFIVHDAEVIPSEQAIVQRLMSDEFDPSRTVILEEEPTTSLDQAASPSQPDLHGAEITSYTPQQLTIDAELTADGFLVLSDTYYPGWKVFVDGREETIYQADYLFRAVPLRRGKHVVEFQYRPLSFRIGLAISLASGILLCGLLVYSVLVRRRQRK